MSEVYVPSWQRQGGSASASATATTEGNHTYPSSHTSTYGGAGTAGGGGGGGVGSYFPSNGCIPSAYFSADGKDPRAFPYHTAAAAAGGTRSPGHHHLYYYGGGDYHNQTYSSLPFPPPAPPSSSFSTSGIPSFPTGSTTTGGRGGGGTKKDISRTSAHLPPTASTISVKGGKQDFPPPPPSSMMGSHSSHRSSSHGYHSPVTENATTTTTTTTTTMPRTCAVASTSGSAFEVTDTRSLGPSTFSSHSHTSTNPAAASGGAAAAAGAGVGRRGATTTTSTMTNSTTTVSSQQHPFSAAVSSPAVSDMMAAGAGAGDLVGPGTNGASVTSAPITPSLADRSPIARLPMRMKSPLWVPPSPATQLGLLTPHALGGGTSSHGNGGRSASTPGPNLHGNSGSSSSHSHPSHSHPHGGGGDGNAKGGAGASGGPMNPFAMEFAPLLPSTTAAAAAAAAQGGGGSGGTANIPLRMAEGPGPSVGKSATTSMREMLNVAAYIPERTLNRVTLQRPTLLINSSVAHSTSGFSLPSSGAGGRDGKGSHPMDGGDEHGTGIATYAGMFRDLWKLHYHPRMTDRWGGGMGGGKDSAAGGAGAGGGHSSHNGYHPVMVAAIEDIPTFWKVWNNVPPPTQKRSGTYYFFRDDIAPKWEDEANRHGGMLRLSMGESIVDLGWEALLLRCVGASWTWPELRLVVNGIGVKMRDCKTYVVEIWVTKDSEELRRDLQDLWKSELGETLNMTYTSFASSVAATTTPTGPAAGMANAAGYHNAHGSRQCTTHNSSNNNVNRKTTSGSSGGKISDLGGFRSFLCVADATAGQHSDPASNLRFGK